MIVRGGADIYPAEIEAALVEHPAISDAVIVGLPCEEYGARIHAIVHRRKDLSPEEIDAFIRTRLAAYKCPASYDFAETALHDEAGKVRRAALRDERLRWLAEEQTSPIKSPRRR